MEQADFPSDGIVPWYAEGQTSLRVRNMADSYLREVRFRSETLRDSPSTGLSAEDRYTASPNVARKAAAGGYVIRYGRVLVFVAIALLLEKLLQHFFPYPFLLLFFAAVIASAWTGGVGPGLFAVLISILSVDYFFIPPLDSFVINAAAAAYCAAFIVSALLAAWVSASVKNGERAVRYARDQLEIRVRERTTELQRSNGELIARERQLEVSNTELRAREQQLQLVIESQQRAERALMKTRAELAHLSRVLTMGELTSSIAHEITQPLTAVVVHGDTGLECLSAEPPDLAEAQAAFERVIADGTRAGDVLRRIRALFKKEAPPRDSVDMNEVIRELTALLNQEVIRQKASLETELADDLPQIHGERIQLQQVVLNLIMNALDAVSDVDDQKRKLRIFSTRPPAGGILIGVEDNGIGLNSDMTERVFDPFYTTKPQGIGMGLPISRSIVESHGGRLWAAARSPRGAIFQFTIPVESPIRNV